MPLSEHEQRMLEQIESALYAEDPKFASSVKRRRIGPGGGRRRLQAAAIFVIGLVLLVGGVAVDVKLGGFPIISLIGFLVMFGACLMALWGGIGGGGSSDAAGSSGSTRSAARKSGASRRKLSDRMEERFNRRFDQEQ